jgi:hypothetical protein
MTDKIYKNIKKNKGEEYKYDPRLMHLFLL